MEVFKIIDNSLQLVEEWTEPNKTDTQKGPVIVRHKKENSIRITFTPKEDGEFLKIETKYNCRPLNPMFGVKIGTFDFETSGVDGKRPPYYIG